MATLKIIEATGPPAEVEVDDNEVGQRIASIAENGFFGELVNGKEVFIPNHSIIRVEIERA